MRDFFRGWRRKVGCVTLLIALMFMIVWGRSYFYEDHIWIAFSRERAIAVHTAVDRIAISGEWQEANGRQSVTAAGATMIETKFDASKCFDWVAVPTEHSADYDPWGVTHWYWSWGRFGYGEWDDGTLGFRMLVVPYWILILPLSLLSGYLILWKPHRALLPASEGPSDG